MVIIVAWDSVPLALARLICQPGTALCACQLLPELMILYNGTYKLQFTHMMLSNAHHPMAYLHVRAKSQVSRRT